MAVCEGYFDESGSFGVAPGIFCVSGYFIEAQRAREMTDAWVSTLAAYGLPYFHMVDCAHGSGIFASIEKQGRIELVTRLIRLIKQYTLSGFSALVQVGQFKPSVEMPDAYVACSSMCATALFSYLQIQQFEGEIAYFFEAGHSSQGLAYKHLAKQIANNSSTVTFASKMEAPLLQAADLLAWQTTKYAKDRMSGVRPMRKDFASLVEHEHSLAYLGLGENNEEQVTFEDWPLSRRSQNTVAIELHTAGEVDYFCEVGDATPIVLLHDPIGWRQGGGKLIHVHFNALRGKRIALAFDEAHLRATISALTHALEAQSNGND